MVGQQITTRRGALGILATGPLAMLPALAVMQCSAPVDAAPLGQLASAIQRYRAASKALARFDKNVHSPALKAYAAAVAKVPHYQTSSSFINVYGERITLSTDSEPSVAGARSALARSTLSNVASTETHSEYHATIAELVSAADRRDAEIARLRVKFGLAELRADEDRHTSAAGDTMWEAIECPVGSLQELCAKIDFIEEMEAWDNPDAGEAVSEDIRRLAGRA